MAHLPPVGWADVATKHDLHALEERLELRLTAEIASVRTELHEGLRNMTLTCVGATTALVSLITILANRI